MSEHISEYGILIDEIEFYDYILPDLLVGYLGQYALIGKKEGSDLCEFVGAFDTEADAVQVGYHEFGNKPFLTKKVRDPSAPGRVVIRAFSPDGFVGPS